MAASKHEMTSAAAFQRTAWHHRNSQSAAPPMAPQPAAIPAAASRTGNILSGIAVLFMLFDGGMKLFQSAAVIDAQSQLGIPAHLTLMIGIIELLCTVLYLMPGTSAAGAILLTGYLGGAVAVQLRAENPLFSHVLFPLYIAAFVWGGLLLRNSAFRRQVLPAPKIRLPRSPARQHIGHAPSCRINVALWSGQIVLAGLFLFAGGMKLLVPPDVLQSMGSPGQVVFPGWFIRFIGVAEVLGAIGLILPQLLRIRPVLTPAAAAGLTMIMLGATAVTLIGGQTGGAMVPLAIGSILSLIAMKRWQSLPQTA